MYHGIQPRDTKRLTVALTSLISGLFALVVWRGLTAPPSLEAQIHSSLGCRNNAAVLILKLSPEGDVRWPDGVTLSIEESTLLLPSWCQKHQSPVVAFLGDKDTAMAQVYPLLAAAQELGVRRVIFTMSQRAALSFLSDATPTVKR